MPHNNSSTQKGILHYRSPIFWRIAAGVFTSILIIEAALLIFSWITERDRVVDRLNHSLNRIPALLDIRNPSPQLERLINNKNTADEYKIIGYTSLNYKGDIVDSGGNIAGIGTSSEKYESGFIGANSKYYSTQFVLDESKTEHHIVRLKVDTSSLSSYMRNYVWRILGMIVLISLFVTGACLIFLTPLLIKPLQRLRKLLKNGEVYGIEEAIAEPADLERNDELGQVFRSFGHLRDELIDSNNERARILERFEEFAGLGADCFWEVDGELKFDYVAGDTERLLGTSSDELVGINVKSLNDHLDNRVTGSEELLLTLEQGGKWEGRISPVDDDASDTFIRISASRILDTNEQFTGVRGIIADITKEHELSEKLRYQATHDHLTGLSNRRQLTELLNVELDNYKTTGQQFCLSIIDLDRFKFVNDNCGHTAGDQLLQSIAKEFKSALNEQDTLARIGGDEFAVIHRNVSIKDAQKIVESIRSSVEEYRFVWEGEFYKITTSIGLAEVAENVSSIEALVYAADNCCIEAKKAGKNQIKTHNSEDNGITFVKDEAVWISRISHAIENEGFTLFRQTLEPLDDDCREDHFEILLRMGDTEGGYWSPGLFLPVAERNDLMPRIDEWVVRKSFEWLKGQTIDADVAFCMNINISAASLSDSLFQRFLIEKVSQFGELNKLICFEVTESVAMSNYKSTIELLTKLNSFGCNIALDDFGTGFSSLSHIRELPLDYIKIDGTFIQQIHNNKLDQALVKSVVEIASVLGVKTVAEFVDSDDALNLLKRLKVDYAQGYLISKPEELIQPTDKISKAA